jgi:hypothetical protein
MTRSLRRVCKYILSSALALPLVSAPATAERGSTFTTIVGSAGYTFNPATGNTVTITFGATSRRFIRLNFTANTGWPAGQVSELQVFAP